MKLTEIVKAQTYEMLRAWIDAGPAAIGLDLYREAQHEMNRRVTQQVDAMKLGPSPAAPQSDTDQEPK